ncbi:hypothetical protein [Limisalsivibrio acetivorans]|uniref:hypothetical protein n=1 Tax=Limisalsivibrio acetivorans TaxID=1304888 RepID=UPI0003B60312|nr:hypothetical protein [Limisalsivibrio acetivorans]
MSYKLDALLSAEFGSANVDFGYVDVSTPEVLEFINDVSNIVENRLPLPYITLNERALCWGVKDPAEIVKRVKERLQEAG